MWTPRITSWSRLSGRWCRRFLVGTGDSTGKSLVSRASSWVRALFRPQVRIICPASLASCHPNVILVDAPGVQDANAARGTVVKKLLEDASSVVIVSAIKRAATERVAQDMLSERFRRQLLMDGHYGRLAFVASCSDEMTLSELRQNLKAGGEDLGKRGAALLRNARTKEKIAADCFAGLRRIEQQSEMQTRRPRLQLYIEDGRL